MRWASTLTWVTDNRERPNGNDHVDFSNVYDDPKRAESYDKLDFPGTYYIAFRDIPRIIEKQVKGRAALDFGCGTGRSTRFLRAIGFEVVGVDIAEDMLAKARTRDPQGDYRRVADGNLHGLPDRTYDLVLSAFTFDNIPTTEKKVAIFREIARVLKESGRIVNLVSSPEIYTHEWASFTTKDFPENRRARSGDKVKIVMTDVDDRRPVEDIIWVDDAYRDVYGRAGLDIVETLKPLAKGSEPFHWVSETTIAPWVIYVLKKV
jgi:ubiquinone/menaquinone biosynthesis C-methylase UbiE